MFNSTLLTDYPILQHAIHDRQRDIVEFPYDLWLDNGDQIFDGYFCCFFPPGFIDRDKERAKKVIRDIHDIVQSPVIRYNPEAIHCYVMYHMMEAWFDDEYTKTLDLLPADVKEFLKGMDKEENSEDEQSEHDRVVKWFTDKDSCLGDFEDTYDPDYMDETVAEGAAEAYLKNGFVPDSLGVDIKELVELLPNDLYDRVVEKLKDTVSTKRNMNDIDRNAILKTLGIKTYTGKVFSEENGKTKIEYMRMVDKDGKEVDEEEAFLTDQLIIACSYAVNNPVLTRNQNENGVNRLIRNQLEPALIGPGYTVSDQSQQGESESGKDSGNVDIIIKKDQIIVALVECLDHSSKNELRRHILKATKNYNQSGCKNVYIICYSRGVHFDTFWNSFTSWAAGIEGIEIWGDRKTDYSGIRCQEGRYNHDGINGKIFFIGANIQ